MSQLRTLQQKVYSASRRGPAIVAVDLDNLTLHRGGYRRVDVVAFCARARAEVGRDCLIKVFANGMSGKDEADWRANGVEVIRTRTNADDAIREWLYASGDASAVLLGSGDGRAFTDPCNFHRRLHHRVVVWSCRAKAAYSLLRAADRVEFCDELLLRKAA
jgi:hypothetical protein